MNKASTTDLLAAEPVQWDFHDADTRQLTHSIHRYSGKFIPQIARQAIDLLTEPDHLILDPYAGSGTTLLEAMLAGRRAVGIDISPLAVLISRTKVTPIDHGALHELWRAAATIPFDRLAGGLGIQRVAGAAETAGPLGFDDPYFEKWFSEEALASLSAIRIFADQLEDQRLRNVTLVAMSDILRKVSRAHQGFPNVMFDRRRVANASVRTEFLGRLKSIIAAVGELYEATRLLPALTAPTVVLGRAEHAHVADGEVDAVISHPPYIGSVPYAEYGQLSLKWLGSDPKDLDAKLTGGKRQSKDVVARFREGYEGMLRASANAIKPDGKIFLLTGNPTVKGEVVDLAAMTSEIAARIGLSLHYTADRKGVNRRANKMDLETVTVWGKS
jgi:hypothetical protein